MYERDGALVVRDCDSLNGTFIDDRRINEAVVKPGERLTVGPLTFVAVYEHAGELGTSVSNADFVALHAGSAADENPPELPTPVNPAQFQFEVEPPDDAADADTAERIAPALPAEATEPTPAAGGEQPGPSPVLPTPVGGAEPQADSDKTFSTASEQTIRDDAGEAAQRSNTDEADESGSDDSALADFLKDLQ